MAIARRFLVEKVCYHLITRGNQKQKVFNDPQDYHLYLHLLKKFKKRHKFRVYAYCLMPNHVHLLGDIEHTKSLSKFMHNLNRTYVLYFNKRYEKVGHLWQGRFKSKIVAKDNYLLDCLSYIELNPVRAKLVPHPQRYRWSSYNTRILNTNDGITDSLYLLT